MDPSFGKSSYNDIKSVDERYRLEVFTEFQRNGKTLAYPVLQTNVERVLRASGILIPSKGSDHSITVIVNNIANMGEAAAKGFGTGFTFGLIGTKVTDYYELKKEAILKHKTQNPDRFVDLFELMNSYRAAQCNAPKGSYAEAYNFNSSFPFSDIREILPLAIKLRPFHIENQHGFL